MQFWKLVFWASMSSYTAFLDASANAGKTSKGGQRFEPRHRNVPVSLDSKLDHGERIVAKLTSEIGAEKTAELLESLAKKANGSQPSGEQGVVDLDSDDDGAALAKVPYGFWRRFCEDDFNFTIHSAQEEAISKSIAIGCDPAA